MVDTTAVEATTPADSNGTATDGPPAAPVQKTSNQPAAKNGEPEWLPGRLEQERRAVLRDLGVTDVKDVKAALEELNKRRDAEKTEGQRLIEENARLRQAAERLQQYEPVVKAQADHALGILTEAQRQFVTNLAGDDPAKVMKVIGDMRAGGLLPSQLQDPASPAATPPPAPKAPPATTGPGNRAPLETSNTIPTLTMQQQYEAAYRAGDVRKAAIINQQAGGRLTKPKA